MRTKIIKYATLVLILTLMSCEKLLDVKQESSITDQVYWQNEGDFYTYLNGIYARYRSHIDYFPFSEERGDMLAQGYNARFSNYWAQSITPGNSVDWTTYYGTIGNVNLLLSKIEPFVFSNPDTKNRIEAEAHALRAAVYFYIARVWGDVPLVLEPVLSAKNPLYKRSPASDVFAQINDDIAQALSLFPEDTYVNKYKFSKPAVYALLADVKMWTGTVLGGGATDFNAAIDAITNIEDSGVSLLPTFGDIFDTKKNNEIIFSFYLNRSEYTSGQINTCFPRYDTSFGADNYADLPAAIAGQAGFVLSPQALALINTYPGDKRVSRTYIAELYSGVPRYYWPNKYRGTKYADDRIADNDIILYRLADMLLLKAEAYADLNDPTNALKYLNMVRTRAGIPEYTETTQALLQREILDERGRELFTEMKRWYDLRRAGALGVIDLYQYIPNLVGKTTPLYWAVQTNVMAKDSLLKQTAGY